jgi:chromosome segregation ATPase
MKWPGQKSSAPTTQPADDGAAKTSATRPVKTSAVTPQQEIDQLQRQVKTLRERLNFIEDKNIK